MKTNIIKSICALVSIAIVSTLSSYAYDVKIRKKNDTTDFSARVLVYSTYGLGMEQYFYITNSTGIDMTWKMQCVKTIRGCSTYEDLCIGVKNRSGSCQHFSRGEATYITYNQKVMSNDECEVKVGIKRFGKYPESIPLDTGTVLYRYNLLDDQGKVLSFFDMEVTFKNQPVTVDLADDNSNNPFSLYPNPASDFLTIQLYGISSGKLRLINFTGQTVLEMAINETTSIMLNDYCQGVYIAEFISQEGLISRQTILINK